MFGIKLSISSYLQDKDELNLKANMIYTSGFDYNIIVSFYSTSSFATTHVVVSVGHPITY